MMTQVYASESRPTYAESEGYTSVDVPMTIATPENFSQYGRFVADFDREEVWITQWPQEGRRPIATGTGHHGGVAEGDYTMAWDGDLLKGHLRAVKHQWIIARKPDDVSSDDRTHALVWDVNYHPDGGQVFYPKDGDAFVALLALPGDEVKLEDFRAFYFDGSVGVQIKPYVWHTGMLPTGNDFTYLDKQGRILACVALNTIEEEGKFLKVPLRREYAQK